MSSGLDTASFGADEVADLVESILQASTECSIIATDLEGTVLLWNEGARRRYGYEPAEVLGRSQAFLYSPEDVEAGRPRAMMEAALERGKWEDVVKCVRKDGSRFQARVVLTPRRDANGKPVGFLLISNVELETASRAKDHFLASMSHELRTPLNAIIGFTGTLLMRLPGELNEEQERQLTTVQSSGRRLLSVINDLLDLAKIDSGKRELSLEPVSCQTVMSDVAESLRRLAEQKGLQLDVKAPQNDVVALTDRRALHQVLANLAGNAIKFTETGSVRLELATHGTNGHNEIALSVVDTGIGITPEDQQRLFTAFERVGDTKSRREEGVGLGLHLSQKLTELMGGRIAFESEPGVGSTFTVVLPAH